MEGWVFFKHLFLPWIGPVLADHVAGTIILAAAPCTAMVFVWSYLTHGDPAYTLVQVSLNDLIMLLLFATLSREEASLFFRLLERRYEDCRSQRLPAHHPRAV